MDCKELLGQLYRLSRTRDALIHTEMSFACADAANAIETLLAERDALIEELRGICWCCAHGRKWENAPGWSKMTTCEHLKDIGVLARSGGKTKCPHWEWRGAKGVAIDAVAELHDQG